MSVTFDGLAGRELERVLADLERAYPRALADNPEGAALVAAALRDAMRLGFEAGCRRAGRQPEELDYGGADAWERWQQERERSPEGLGWPAELEAGAPQVIADARALLADAGAGAAVGIAAVVALLVCAGAVVVWSERASRG